MQLVDTHCHIHEADYPLDREAVYQRAIETGVTKMVCVGTDEASSRQAVEFAAGHENAWATIGVHPHEAKNGLQTIETLRQLANEPKVVAVGECGLDYYYTHSPKDVQEKILRAQIELALEHNLPMSFHVREAFDDFWPIFDDYKNIRGVLHSFTDSQENLEKAIERGLYVGVNGISTFTKIEVQQEMFRHVPLDRLLLETDAPFLTPVPKRGTLNEPAYVMHVATHLAALHAVSLEELAEATTQGANKLFSL